MNTQGMWRCVRDSQTLRWPIVLVHQVALIVVAASVGRALERSKVFLSARGKVRRRRWRGIFGLDEHGNCVAACRSVEQDLLSSFSDARAQSPISQGSSSSAPVADHSSTTTTAISVIATTANAAAVRRLRTRSSNCRRASAGSPESGNNWA